MRKVKNKKARQQYRHAKNRAFERYGLCVSDDDLETLVREIQAGKTEHVFRQSQRVSIFKAHFKDKDVQVVYDGQRKTIVTFIPLDDPCYDCTG